jgi:predicted Zn-dependent protease
VLFVPLIPLTYEERLGKQMMEHVSKEMGGKCQDERAQKALRRFVGELLGASQITRPVNAVFLNSKVVNAFAAPGGNIAVLRGIVEASESSDELGGVIAHEIGHVLNRHALQGAAKRFGLGIISSYLGASLDTVGNISLLASATMFDMSYSRDHEREADSAGVKLLQAAGINSRGAAALFARLKEKKGDKTGVAALLATHPSLEERIRNLSPSGREGRAAFTAEEWRIIKLSCG